MLPGVSVVQALLLSSIRSSPTTSHSRECVDYVSMDFIEGLLVSDNMDSVLVVVDRLNKYGHFIGLRHRFSTLGMGKIFIKEVVRFHGVMRSIVSDCDKVFASAFRTSCSNLKDTWLKEARIIAHKPMGKHSGDHTLELIFGCFVEDMSKPWSSWLLWAEYSYKMAYHIGAHMAKFSKIMRFEAGSAGVDAVDMLASQ